MLVKFHGPIDNPNDIFLIDFLELCYTPPCFIYLVLYL